MKKSQLKNIIRESIRGLMTEQSLPVPGSVSPSSNPANAKQVNWEYCDPNLNNLVAGPGHPNAGLFFGDGNPGDGQLQDDNNTPPTSNGPNDQFMTQCITLGGGNIPGVGDGFQTAEAGTLGTVIRDAKVIGVGECTSAWGGNTIDLPYSCGTSSSPTNPVGPCDKDNFINYITTNYPQFASLAGYEIAHFCEECNDNQGSGPSPISSFDLMCKCCKKKADPTIDRMQKLANIPIKK